MRFLSLLLLLVVSILAPASSSAEGWPGDALTVGSMPGRIHSAWSALVSGDSFGRVRVSQPVIEGDVKFTADLQPLRVGTIATGGATVAHAAPLPQARLRVNGATQRALIRSFEHYRYRAAQSQLIRMTGVLGAPVAGVEARMGYFSDSDGIFLAQSPTGPVLVIRSSASGVVVERRIPQASWNVDTLLTGPNALDLTKGVVMVIDLQYLGHGAVRLGFDLGMGTHWVHREQHSNLQAAPYMVSGSQPLSWELVTTALYAGPQRDMMATCGSVVREGGEQEPGASGGTDMGVVPVSVVAADAAGEAVLLLRRKAGYSHAALRPVGLDCLNVGSNPMRWRLLLKPTLGGAAPVWVGVAGGAAIGEVSTTAGMSTTGGIPIASGYIAAGTPGRGIGASVDVARTLPLVADLSGTSDILALELNQAGGATTALCSLTWEALQ